MYKQPESHSANFPLSLNNNFQDSCEIHHFGEHLCNVRMVLCSTDELLQGQLTWIDTKPYLSDTKIHQSILSLLIGILCH